MATKLSAAVDDEGVPLICTPGNQSDMRLLQPTLAAAILPTPTGTPLNTDKGYDSAANRHTCVVYGYGDRIFRRRTSWLGSMQGSCDRDALASLNMVSCALGGGRTWPEHLCRGLCRRCE